LNFYGLLIIKAQIPTEGRSIHMKKIKIGLVGANGRMGKTVQRLIKTAPYHRKYELIWKAPSSQKPWPLVFDLKPKVKPDVVIDFSLPQGTLRAAALCGVHKVPLLVCVTGLKPSEVKKIQKLMGRTKWKLTPNTSLGIHAFHHILAAAAGHIPESYQVKMVEAHHIHKKDKPSGTAKALAQTFENKSRQKIKIDSIRKGKIVGIHSLVIQGPHENITLTHSAMNRSLFAHGALVLARKLLDQK